MSAERFSPVMPIRSYTCLGTKLGDTGEVQEAVKTGHFFQTIWGKREGRRGDAVSKVVLVKHTEKIN